MSKSLSAAEKEKGRLVLVSIFVVAAVFLWLEFSPTSTSSVELEPVDYARDVAMDLVRSNIADPLHADFDYQSLKMIDLTNNAYRIAGKVSTPTETQSWNIEIAAKENCSDYDDRKCWAIQEQLSLW